MFNENRIFKYALITSICVHSFLVLMLWITNIQYYKDDKKKVVEITYQSKAVQEKILLKKKEHIKSVKPKRQIPMPKMLTKRNNISPNTVEKNEKTPAKLKLPQKTLSRMHKTGEKRQIKIPMLDSDKMMGSRYMSYHEQVRDKIRNRAYFYVDDPQFEAGEVYLTFVLGSNGELKQVKIIHDKTRANNYLRSVGLRSIKESAPFPPFPKDLDYPELTFNVVISFEMAE